MTSTIIAYRDRETGRYPLSDFDLRQRFDGGLPADLTQAEFDLLEVDPVFASDRPSFDPAKQMVEENAPTFAKGRWVQAWRVIALPPPPADANSINAERDRRLALGMSFAGHPFQTDALDRERIDRSRISAMAAIMGGAQAGDMRWHGLPVDFFWIAADDTRVPMDAQTMVAFGNAVAAREGLLIVAGNDLKRRIAAGEAIADITENVLWPE